MKPINTVVIEGNLTRDCEVRAYTGGELATFSVAVNERKKNKAGEWEDETSYIDCKLFNASKAVGSLTKGAHAVVSGRIKQERWTAKDGGNASKIVVIAESVSVEKQRKTDAKQEPEQSVYDADLPF